MTLQILTSELIRRTVLRSCMRFVQYDFGNARHRSSVQEIMYLVPDFIDERLGCWRTVQARDIGTESRALSSYYQQTIVPSLL